MWLGWKSGERSVNDTFRDQTVPPFDRLSLLLITREAIFQADLIKIPEQILQEVQDTIRLL